jgi:acetyltransferase-like isoleucine patch superfamily enzyme
MILSSSASKTSVIFPRLLMDPPMAGTMLSTEPTVDPTASVRDCKLGAYTEVGARTILLEVAMADYSYVVNDSQITYTTIGKFCSIAAMTRINPGNHPMQRASQAHFTYRASSYFPGESDDTDFFAWRRGITSISATTSGSATARSFCPAARSAPARWSRPAPS